MKKTKKMLSFLTGMLALSCSSFASDRDSTYYYTSSKGCNVRFVVEKNESSLKMIPPDSFQPLNFRLDHRNGWHNLSVDNNQYSLVPSKKIEPCQMDRTDQPDHLKINHEAYNITNDGYRFYSKEISLQNVVLNFDNKGKLTLGPASELVQVVKKSTQNLLPLPQSSPFSAILGAVIDTGLNHLGKDAIQLHDLGNTQFMNVIIEPLRGSDNIGVIGGTIDYTTVPGVLNFGARNCVPTIKLPKGTVWKERKKTW